MIRPELRLLEVQVVRWVDDGFPGVVACEFMDAQGRVHTVIDRVPVVSTDELDATSAYPQPGSIRCMVAERWVDGNKEDHPLQLVQIHLGFPDAVESTEGLQEFVVLSSQVSWIPRGHREETTSGV